MRLIMINLLTALVDMEYSLLVQAFAPLYVMSGTTSGLMISYIMRIGHFVLLVTTLAMCKHNISSFKTPVVRKIICTIG